MRDSTELLPLCERIRLYLPSIWISRNNPLNLAVVDMLSQLSYSLFTRKSAAPVLLVCRTSSLFPIWCVLCARCAVCWGEQGDWCLLLCHCVAGLSSRGCRRARGHAGTRGDRRCQGDTGVGWDAGLRSSETPEQSLPVTWWKMRSRVWIPVEGVGNRKAEPNVIISGFGVTCLHCCFLFPACGVSLLNHPETPTSVPKYPRMGSATLLLVFHKGRGFFLKYSHFPSVTAPVATLLGHITGN